MWLSNQFKLEKLSNSIHLHRLSKGKLACVSVFVFVSVAFFSAYYFVVFSSSSLLSFYLLSLIFIVIQCMKTYNLSRALEKNNNRAKRATLADDVERNIFFSSIHIICCNFQHWSLGLILFKIVSLSIKMKPNETKRNWEHYKEKQNGKKKSTHIHSTYVR